MKKLIDINSYPVSAVLKSLVKDKTTGKNILFATDVYLKGKKLFDKAEQITERALKHLGTELIQPRVAKSQEKQAERTREKAEVFTPSWVCNKMNNHCDTEWFGRKNVFNTENGQTWEPTTKPIKFDSENDWQKYVDCRRIEITCGEAPYIVSRYDSTTAEIIPLKKRIGILDRKMRIVYENTDNEEDWLKWTYRAFQSTYGYEYQGDNLLIARINLLITFMDYMQDRWERAPTKRELNTITNIIVWNFWQMDGLTGTTPFGLKAEEIPLNFFDYGGDTAPTQPENMECRIYDWQKKKSLTYNSIKEGA